MSKTSCVQLALVIISAFPTYACVTETDQPSAQPGVTTAALFNATENCSDEQIHTIEQAQAGAAFAGISVMNDLGSVFNGGDTSRIDYWFGAHTDYVLDTVDSKFTQIAELFNSAVYVCDCPNEPPGTFGQATPFDPEHKIRLCDSYFAGDYEEIQVGTLFHEASHLTGTDHYIDAGCIAGDPYGWPESIHDRAQGLPSLAVLSAEPYRLYALDWAPGRKSTLDRGCPH